MMAGRLTGTLDGRPVVIDAGEDGVLVNVASLHSAWAARRTAGPLVPALRLLKRGNVPLRLRIAGLVTVDLLPKPRALVSFLAPTLSRLG